MKDNKCLSCSISCCQTCEHYCNKLCNIYNNRPLKCRLFPYYYNIYKNKVESLKTCPEWEYFDSLLTNEIKIMVIGLTVDISKAFNFNY